MSELTVPFTNGEEVVICKVDDSSDKTMITVSNGTALYTFEGKGKMGDKLTFAVGGTESFIPVVAVKESGRKLNPPKDIAQGYDC